MTRPDPNPRCTVCSTPAERRLCSDACVRAAVQEREHNVRQLRSLRRGGEADAGAALVGRNAELTSALLTERPRPGPSGNARLAATAPPGTPSAAWTVDDPDAATQPMPLADLEARTSAPAPPGLVHRR